jgi:hypothetical protein
VSGCAKVGEMCAQEMRKGSEGDGDERELIERADG